MSKRILFSLVILAAAGILAESACAQGPTYPRDITFTLNAPTEYTDGSPILDSDGLSLEVSCTRNDGTIILDREPFLATVTPGAEIIETFVGVIPNSGTYSCQAFAVVDSISSAPSNTATKRYTGQPGPPVIIVFAE